MHWYPQLKKNDEQLQQISRFAATHDYIRLFQAFSPLFGTKLRRWYLYLLFVVARPTSTRCRIFTTPDYNDVFW